MEMLKQPSIIKVKPYFQHNNFTANSVIYVPLLKRVDQIREFGLNTGGFPQPLVPKEYSVNNIKELNLSSLRYDTQRYP